MITSAGYNQDGSIQAVINGASWTLPITGYSRFRQYVDDWVAQGNTITPYTPVVVYPDLLKWQLWLAGLELTPSITKAKVLAAVLADDTMSLDEQETVRIFLDDTSAYSRADPRVNMLATKMGLTQAEMDSLWLWASTFTPAA